MAKTNTKKPAPAPAPDDEQAAAPDNAAPAQQPDPNADSNDSLIAAVQDKVRASVPPQFRVAVQKIYLAGMKLMYSPETHQIMTQQLQGSEFPAQAVARGVAALMTIMFRQSKGTMPLPAATPAAILLVCEALDYMEQTKQVQMSPELLSDAVQQVVAILLQKVGLSPDKLMSGINQNAQNAGMQVPGQQQAPTAASTAPGQNGLIQAQMGG